MLYLQADHLFFEKMGSEEATIDVMTRHVQRVNSIYKEIGKKKAFVEFFFLLPTSDVDRKEAAKKKKDLAKFFFQGKKFSSFPIATLIHIVRRTLRSCTLEEN